MKFCTNCGKQIDDNAIFCPHCGTRTNGDSASYTDNGGFGGFGGFNPYGPFSSPYHTYPVYDQRESKLISVISFLSWQIGLILWIVFRSSRPGKARSAAKGLCAGISVSLPILGGVLWMIWRDDENMRDYARLAGICAIIGAAVYALLIGALVLIGVADILAEGGAVGGDMAAFILRYFK